MIRKSASRCQSSWAEELRRLMAAGGAALVLALSVFAASPSLHQWLHSDTIPGGDDECPVALFATGVSAPAAPVTVSLPSVAWLEFAHPTVEQIFLASPRYLHQPERGPPLS